MDIKSGEFCRESVLMDPQPPKFLDKALNAKVWKYMEDLASVHLPVG